MARRTDKAAARLVVRSSTIAVMAMWTPIAARNATWATRTGKPWTASWPHRPTQPRRSTAPPAAPSRPASSIEKRTLGGSFTSPAKSVVGQSPTTLTRSTIERKGPWEGPLHPPRRVSSGKAQRHSRDQLLKKKDPGRVLYIPREECRRAKPNETQAINYLKKRTLGGSFTSPAKSVVGQSPTTLTRSTIERKGPWEGPLHPPRRVSSGKAQRHSRDQLARELCGEDALSFGAGAFAERSAWIVGNQIVQFA